MRDSILRVVDDLQTKKKDVEERRNTSESSWTRAFFEGHGRALDYAIRELRKVLDENPKV